jgi:hypothetical protein
VSFLGQVFVEENIRSITAAALAARLVDELFALNERLVRWPRTFAGLGDTPGGVRGDAPTWAI